MKKLYILLIVLLPVFANAQITVTQSDLPVAGVGYINASDDTYVGAIPAGGNTSWNYATLQNNSQDTTLFINAAGTPYAADFPGANLAQHDIAQGSYTYFTSNSTGLLFNGSVYMFLVAYNPAQMLVPVPFTYNSTYSGYSRLQFEDTVNTPHTKTVFHTNINIVGDGYGQLTLPSMTVPNALRTKTTSVLIDSAFYDLGLGGGYQLLPGYPTSSQSTDFKWLRNGGGGLLLEISADSAGQTGDRSSYLVFSGSLGVNPINQPVFTKTFPNPASDRVTFNFENPSNEKTNLTIFNQLGQDVELHDVTQFNTFSMTTSHLPNGLYSYTVQNEKGTNTKGKFIVIH